MYTCPMVGCSAENLLAALECKMTGTKKRKPADRTAVVPVRLPTQEIDRLETEAAAAHLSRSAYIALLLSGQRPPEYSAELAALAQIISVCATIKVSRSIEDHQMHDLKLLVRTLAVALREEPIR